MDWLTLVCAGNVVDYLMCFCDVWSC